MNAFFQTLSFLVLVFRFFKIVMFICFSGFPGVHYFSTYTKFSENLVHRGLSFVIFQRFLRSFTLLWLMVTNSHIYLNKHLAFSWSSVMNELLIPPGVKGLSNFFKINFCKTEFTIATNIKSVENCLSLKSSMIK